MSDQKNDEIKWVSEIGKKIIDTVEFCIGESPIEKYAYSEVAGDLVQVPIDFNREKCEGDAINYALPPFPSQFQVDEYDPDFIGLAEALQTSSSRYRDESEKKGWNKLIGQEK